MNTSLVSGSCSAFEPSFNDGEIAHCDISQCAFKDGNNRVH